MHTQFECKPDDHGRGRIYTVPGGTWVATTWKADEQGNEIPALENGKLFAAAPDLLALVQRLVNASDAEHPDFLDSGADVIEMLWNEGPRIIAKAKGVQP